MGANADTLKSAYEAFGRGDIEATMESWADDIRWEGTNDPKLPGGGRHEGKQSVAQALGTIQEAWDDFAVTPDEFHESGDTVIVLGHAKGTAKQTGQSGQWPFVHVWRMQDGKAREALILADTYEIAKMLGVAS
jgi:uncharacterized protein